MMMTLMDVNYVYLIAHKANGEFVGPVKVGFSKYPAKRLASLQTGNPKPIDCVYSFQTPSRELARFAEAAFHEVAKGHRLSGEWFDMSPDLAMNTIVKTMVGVIGDDITDPTNLRQILDWCGVFDAIDVWSDMQPLERADV